MSSPVNPIYSLRTKFMLFACGLVILFSISWGSWTWFHERQMLQNRLEDAGTVLVSSMAIPIINALVYEELGLVAEGGLLDNFVIDIMGNRQLTPVYAIVTDSGGKILAHSQLNRFGQILTDDLTRKVLSASSVILQRQQWQEQLILDVGSPLAIHGKRWGSLRVGLPLVPLEAQLQALAWRIFTFSSLFALCALVIFFIAGTQLVRPLRKLAGVMEQVDGDQLTNISASDRRDELGLLHNSFSRMLKRLRKSEKERDKSIQQLLENERLVTAGRIVSGVAHEINNPLAGIQTALFTIEKKPESLNRYLPHIQNEVERISGIVTQLLDLSRSGEVVKTPTDSRALAEESLRICRMAVKGKRVDLYLSDNAPQTTLDCDARKIQQVILNLVINAADALDGKGEIRLTTALEGGDFCYRVADTGPGVPGHLKEQIFTPFFTTKAAGKGTGIGLAFSLNTIEKHGGSLRLLDSEKGACFEIRLPLNRQDSK